MLEKYTDNENEDENIDNDIELSNIDEDIDDIEIYDDIEIIISDTDIDVDGEIDDSEDSDFDKMFKGTANKHKLEGTHALKRDTIFKGKLDEQQEEALEYTTYFPDFDANNYTIERGSAHEMESRHYEDSYHKQCLVKDVYSLLCNRTDIDFVENRRKPNKEIFNSYYKMSLEELGTKYSKAEIFVEISYYFTDNIFNMFKILDKKYATGLLLELKKLGYLKDIGGINFI